MTAFVLDFKDAFSNREILVATGLLFNTFSWYYLCRLIVNRLGQGFAKGSFEQSCLIIAYLVSILISAIAGAAFLRENRRPRLLKIWIIFGVLTSLLITISASFSFLEILIVTLLLGLSLGVAIPFCLDLIRFATIENRGKVGGVVLFATFSSVFILYGSVSSLDLAFAGLLLALWRFWSLPLIFSVSEKKILEVNMSQKPQKFASILMDKTFLLYFTAWFMFALIDNFQGVVIRITAGEFPLFIRVIEPSVAGFSAIIIGAISDHIGRKQVLISSFVFLGIADAFLSLFPHYWVSWLFYSIVNGIAIGSASMLFMVVIWGEIPTSTSVKFYAIGEIPFFVAEAFSLLLTPLLISIPQGNSFSLAAFFLFIAVIPLMFAPETLPERKIRERELRDYVEKAKRIREKFTKG